MDRIFRFAVVGAVTLLGLTALHTGVRAAAASRQKKVPTLAILPFVTENGSSQGLADRMRFAVGKKMSRNGHFKRLDDHDVDMMISALQIPWTAPVHKADIVTVIKNLATSQTVMGYLKGRRLKLELFVGTRLAKTVTATIPPDTTSPRLTVEAMLTKLDKIGFHHMSSKQVDHSNPAIEKLFKIRPNLVADPNFSFCERRGLAASPDWQMFLEKQDYHPPLISAAKARNLQPDSVAIVPQSVVSGARSHGYCLMLRTSLNTAQNNGLACESLWIPVIDGHRYRFSVQYHSAAPRIRIFLKGFAYWPDAFSSDNNLASQRKEIYRYQLLPLTANKGWTTTEADFSPRAMRSLNAKHPIKWIRIDFFSYLNAGDAFFRRVQIRDITPTAGGGRH